MMYIVTVLDYKVQILAVTMLTASTESTLQIGSQRSFWISVCCTWDWGTQRSHSRNEKVFDFVRQLHNFT